MVVCSRDGAATLGATLDAVLADDAGLDVIVVDSASTTDAVARVAAARGLRCLRVDEPGVSRARNAAAAATAAEVLCFTDDDCRPAPGWARALVAAVTAEPTTGAVFGAVVPARGDGVALSVLEPAAPYDVRLDTLDACGHGANVAVRRTAFDAVGGFDVALGAGAPIPGAEDKDLALRLLTAGWRVRVDPAPVVHHDLKAGRLTALRVSYRYGVGAGALAAKAHRLGVAVQAPGRAAWQRARRAWRDGYRFGVLLDLAHAAGTVAGRRRGRRR